MRILGELSYFHLRFYDGLDRTCGCRRDIYGERTTNSDVTEIFKSCIKYKYDVSFFFNHKLITPLLKRWNLERISKRDVFKYTNIATKICI